MLNCHVSGVSVCQSVISLLQSNIKAGYDCYQLNLCIYAKTQEILTELESEYVFLLCQ